MKVKFFLFLLIIILIGGTAFYFGWIQFQLEEHTYGVMFSKTSGYEEKVIRPGEFNWRWEALIPTNMELHKIEIIPRSVELKKSGGLPSGKIYGRAIDAATEFEYSLGVSLTYSLRPDLLPRLVQDEALSNETLDDFFLETDQRINSLITSYIENRISTNESVTPDDFKTSAFKTKLVDSVQDKLSYLNITSAALTDLKIPDIKLYQSARAFYFDLLETRRKTETATLERQREWTVSQESKIEVLQQYGKLFTDYPGLIQYFALGQHEKLAQLLPEIELIQSTLEGTPGE